MRIISRLDIKQNILIKSIMFDGVRKLGKPEEFAKKYYEEGIDELMLINNTGSLYNTKLDKNIIKDVRVGKAIPISAGGGISCYNDAMELIENGCDKIVLNTLIHKDKNEVKKIINTLGSSSVIGSIQFEKRNNNYISLYEMARETNYLNLNDTINLYIDLGVGEIMLTHIARDGCYSGLSNEINEEILNFNKKVPILLSGGFANKDELYPLKNLLSGVVISSAFHYQKISVKKIIDYRNKITNGEFSINEEK